MTYHITYFNNETDIYSNGVNISGSTIEHIIAKFKVEYPTAIIFSVIFKNNL